MTKSKFVIDKIAKLLEQGLISYKDLSNEILNIIKSKKDEIIFKLDLSTKEELEIVKKRLEILEKKLNKKNKSAKIKKVKKS
jgi:BMFP domain-containing protein YqiC|tara:strand:+ start:244 stop:489 length:246 start_codon:yes stop_codon:yes gene_type:complete